MSEQQVFQISVEGHPKSPFQTTLAGKWLQKSLLQAIVVPLLQSLRKADPSKSSLYQLKLMQSVVVDGFGEVDLNSKRSGVNMPVSDVIEGANAGANEPIFITIALNEPTARPGFLRRLSGGIGGGGATGSSNSNGDKSFILVAPEMTLTTKVNPAWQKKTCAEALIEPFLNAYNLADGVHISYLPADLVGFHIVQDDKDPIWVDANRAIPSPVHAFIYGDVTTLQLVFKGSAEEKRLQQGAGPTVPSLSELMGGMSVQGGPTADDLGHFADSDAPEFMPTPR